MTRPCVRTDARTEACKPTRPSPTEVTMNASLTDHTNEIGVRSLVCHGDSQVRIAGFVPVHGREDGFVGFNLP
jgi:hypothetical protein